MKEEQGSDLTRQPSKFTLYCLAMVGGLGMTMMMAAVMIGVIYGGELAVESTHTLGLLLVSGLLLLVIAIGFWLGWVRPFERFDDINVPAEPEDH